MHRLLYTRETTICHPSQAPRAAFLVLHPPLSSSSSSYSSSYFFSSFFLLIPPPLPSLLFLFFLPISLFLSTVIPSERFQMMGRMYMGLSYFIPVNSHCQPSLHENMLVRDVFFLSQHAQPHQFYIFCLLNSTDISHFNMSRKFTLQCYPTYCI